MKVWNVEPATIEAAARSVGVAVSPIVRRGRALQFTLRLADPHPANPAPGGRRRPSGRPYQRRSPRGRRIPAVCWHGHRDFFRTLFWMAPAAKVSTAQTRRLPRGERFYTRDTFSERYPRTDANIGSLFEPAHYSDCCDCGSEAVARWALTAA
jgi:hypothetical protein